MTPEQRLSQAEILLKTAAKTINSNAEGIKELRESQKQNAEGIKELREIQKQNAEEIKELRESQKKTDEQMRRMSEIVVDTIRVIGVMQNQFTQMQGEIIEIRTEIRGLQRENQRILGYLFGERGDLPPASEN